ncbi:MAG: type IV-A pilus assembly ATPase PilB [Deltaproteobacteria bacterium]|nr:type IV-A pilus assembly ATPase PilB [Deltaproteobacteria bacterium]
MSRKLLEILEQTNYIDKSQAESALKLAEEKNLNIISACSHILNCREEEILCVVSENLHLKLITLDEIELDQSLVDLIPKQLAKKYEVIPIKKVDHVLEIGMLDPTNIVQLNELKFITSHEIKPMLITPSDFERIFETLYEENHLNKIIEDFSGKSESIEVVDKTETVNLTDLEKESESAPVVKLINAILLDAIKKRASDVHFEPFEKFFRIRFRIDGILYEIMRPPVRLKNSLISRLKIMAGLDIAERRLPQDGRIKLRVGSKEIDFRVNTIPSLYGEKAVLRLLDKSNLQLDLEKLGLEKFQLKAVRDAINQPYGLVLVVGPTGSGKTTTLYSAIMELNQPSINISTIEDPIEYQLPGVNQLQVNDEIGLTFASALRAFMRQDPDVILVGEIRDLETAEIAVKASLTGHLVLSTLHTNDSTSTITRLLNMGVEPFLVSTSLSLIISQRLLRRVCASCAEPHHVHRETLLQLGFDESEVDTVKPLKGTGCKACSDTGYKGRVAIYEVLPTDDELKDLVLAGVNAVELRKHAKRKGLQTLRRSALNKVAEGISSLEEVVRVTVND